MASEVINYICPACGGPLHFVGASGKLQCDYCDSSFDVEQVEEMYPGQNGRDASAAGGGNQWNVNGEEWENGSEGLKSYICPACNAELICDQTTAATCCPYCSNQTVMAGQFSGSLKPEFVIPFKTDKEQAKAALLSHYKGKTLLPKSFVEGNHIEEIQGVYVPFWLFDCQAAGNMEFEASSSTKERKGEKEIITTKHYEVRRSGTLPFEKVPADASSKMPDGHMDSIEPFDYRELKSFSMAYMPGFLADKYDVPAEECGGRMEERCRKTFEEEMKKTVTGYDKKTVKTKNITVRRGRAHYAMLPVWLLATKWNGENFLFAMNGQTGKLVGDLPVDKKKYWTFLGGISVLLILLAQLLNAFVLETSLTGLEMAGVCILLPLLAAFIIVSAMKGKLKSVTKQKAGSYITGSGLKLTRKEDIYLRTTTETKIIKKEGA